MRKKKKCSICQVFTEILVRLNKQKVCLTCLDKLYIKKGLSDGIPKR